MNNDVRIMNIDLREHDINSIPVVYDDLVVGNQYYYKPNKDYDKFRLVKLVSKSRTETKELYNNLKEKFETFLTSELKEEKDKADNFFRYKDFVNDKDSEEGVGLQFVEDDNMIMNYVYRRIMIIVIVVWFILNNHIFY